MSLTFPSIVTTTESLRPYSYNVILINSMYLVYPNGPSIYAQTGINYKIETRFSRNPHTGRRYKDRTYAYI